MTMRLRLVLGMAIAACMVAVFMVSPAYGLDVPKAPTLETPIVDQTGTLSTEQIAQLSAQILQSRNEKAFQIGILMIPTLGQNEYLEGYGIKVARAWGIGDKDTDNGALILVVKEDKVMRIEVGRGLEGDLTDVRANRIIRDVMRPKFRQDDYYGGLSGAVNSIQLALSQKADSSINASSTTSDSSGWDTFMTFLVFGGIAVSWIAAMLGRTKSWWAGGIVGGIVGLVLMLVFSWAVWTFFVGIASVIGGFLLDFIVSRNYKEHLATGKHASWWAGGPWIGGGSGGGFGGGGGGSFGGGGFSGGGSSGSW